MKRMGMVVTAAVSLALFSGVTSLEAQSSDSHPIIGAWQLNLTASSYSPGDGPRGMIRRFFELDDGYVASIRITWAQNGNPNFAMVRLKMDGEDYEVWTTGGLGNFLETGERPTATAAFSAVDDRTLSLLQKTDGTPGTLGANTWAVSADGSTLTVTTQGTAPNGTEVHNVEVFDRIEQDDS